MQIADGVAGATELESYVPSDPLTGRPHPKYTSTVLESAEVLRSVGAAVFVENRGPFSRGRTALASGVQAGQHDLLVGYGLEIAGIGAAVQNMWLTAEAYGLSAAFMGDVVIDEAAIAGRLRVEGDLLGVLVLGTSIERPPARDPDLSDSVVWHTRPGVTSCVKSDVP
jgi:nitroreductase